MIINCYYLRRVGFCSPPFKVCCILMHGQVYIADIVQILYKPIKGKLDQRFSNKV